MGPRPVARIAFGTAVASMDRAPHRRLQRCANAHQIASRLGIVHDRLRFPVGEANRGQVGPLVCERLKTSVEEDAVTVIAACLLQREHNQIPRPPFGIVSWFGKNRSYESNPISCRRSIVLVSRAQASFRARVAGSGVSKKIQICPPRPDRERSRDAGMHHSRHVSRKAAQSSCQLALSKSAARNQQVSSRRSGYTPTTILPSRCARIASSVSGRYFRVSGRLACDPPASRHNRRSNRAPISVCSRFGR